jgi:hypothetical protein
LATVLWGNVTINVLLALLSDSVLAGIGAFAFSTIVITLFGEIIPQAYFSRNALRMAARLTPLLKVYRVGSFRWRSPLRLHSTGGSDPKESLFYESETFERLSQNTWASRART